MMNEYINYRIYVDVETTGFDPIRNDIISVAMLVANNDLNVKSEFYDTVRPSFNKFYSDEAEKIHGFTKDEMRQFQKPREMCIKMLNFLKPFKHEENYPQLFISHSLRSFDYRFFEWLFRKQGLQNSIWKMFSQETQRSTIKAARDMGYKTNKLDEWAKRINFELDHHNAISDTRCCYEVDKYLLREL